MAEAILMLSVEKGNNTKQEQDQSGEDAVFFQFILRDVNAFVGIFSEFGQRNAVMFSFFHKKALLFYILPSVYTFFRKNE